MYQASVSKAQFNSLNEQEGDDLKEPLLSGYDAQF